MNAIIPSNLDLDALLSVQRVKFKPRRNKALFVLDAIHYAEASSGEQLRSAVVKEVVSDYQKYLRMFIEAGVITQPRGGGYLASNLAHRLNVVPTCKTYRLKEEYTGSFRSEPLEGMLPYGMMVNKRLHKIPPATAFHAELGSEASRDSHVPSSYSPYMCELVRGTVDNPTLLGFRDGWSDMLRALYEDGQLRRQQFLWFGRLIAHSSSTWLYAISERCGRVSTSVNLLPRELRQYMTIAGEQELAVADVRACIPFLTLKVLRDVGADAAELQEWQEALENGDIYSRFSELLNTHALAYYDRTRPLTRDECKLELLKALFSSNSARLPSRIVLEAWMPSLSASLALLRKGDHRVFAWMIFQEESDLIVRKVGRELSRLGIPAFTIHDGMIVRHRDAEQVRSLMEQVISDAIGARATVTIKAASEGATESSPELASFLASVQPAFGS